MRPPSDDRGVVHVAHDELGPPVVVPEPDASRRAAAIVGLAEVETDDPGAAGRPRQGVGPDVALQVHERATGDVAEVLDLERAQAVGRGDEAVEVVEVAALRAAAPARPTTPGWSRPSRRPRHSSLRSVAHRVSSWRLDSCSLRSTAETWVSTVFTDSVRRRAISLYV